MKKPFTLLFVLFALVSLAQQYSYRQYTIFDGLPQNQVTDLHIDPEGYLWIGTKGGICRFDGQNFVDFTDQESNNTHIRAIFTKSDSLYYYTSGILYCKRGESFQEVYHAKEGDPIIEIFTLDNDKGFLVNTIHNIFRWNYGEKVLLYSNPDERIWLRMYESDDKFVVDENRNVFIFRNGLKTPLPELNQTYSFNDYQSENYFFLKYLTGLDSVFSYNFNSDTSAFWVTYNKNISNIITLPDKKTAVVLNESDWLITDSAFRICEHDILTDNGIRDVVEYNNNLFLGTEKGFFVRNSAAFLNYTEKDNIPGYVWSILEDQDNNIVLAGFFGDLSILDEGAGLRKLDFNLKGTSDFLDQFFYMDGFVRKNGDWVIPMACGVFYGNEMEQMVFYDPMHYSATFCAWVDERRDLLYAGTTNGVYIYQLPEGKILRNIQTDEINVLDIAEDKFGRLWFCTSRKVFLYEHDSLIRFYEQHPELKQAFVSCCRDARGNMWLGNKKGLHLYNYDRLQTVWDGSFTFINTYKDSHIIAGNTFGIVYLDLERFYAGDADFACYFDRFNGFIGREPGQNGTMVSSKGDVWVPTSESVVKFMPDRIYIDTVPPKAFVGSMELSDHELQWQPFLNEPIKMDSVYHLSWDKNNVRLNYHAIKYHCPERLQYRYRLLGYSESWSETAETEALFTNLNPGQYRFQLMAANEHGYWSKVPAVVNFNIVPAYWQTWWFKSLVIFLAAMSIFLGILWYFRLKQKRAQEQRRVEQQLVSVQLNSLNAQLDPHFVFNAISAIGAEVQQNNTERAYDYFVKATRLFRSSLVDKDQITRSLDKELAVVEGYLQLQQLRFSERISYTIEVAGDVDHNMIIPKMSVQVFVENAVKHGLENKLEGGFVNVTISNSDGCLLICIVDNGVGLEESRKLQKESTGLGLKSFKQFFEILNKANSSKAEFTLKTLYDKNGQVEGTEAVLKIPLNYQYSMD